ncbi:MAG TPA: hypothetical protein VH328_14575 [Burkholderiaceae bacterium]|nr:hypothetical protein [Burkholderiaceae bacterium]
MILSRLLPTCLILLPLFCAAQQCPQATPTEGAPPPQPLPVFPSDNWWNLDVSQAPVDPDSAAYIGYIGSPTLHPEFGGTVHKGSAAVYGYPYAVVAGNQPKLAVKMQYADESDGIDHKTNKPYAFYPIPAEAMTQAHWIEGGWAGDVDKRRQSDRHMMIVDCTHRMLYELYNVYYDSTRQQWLAGSGAAWDMTTNDSRTEGWTSAEASGLQMFPGMVRYDEAWNDAMPVIQHALRVTLRATNGHVWPATHSDGTTSGALPFGARLRLKTSVDGQDPALRTSNPNVRKIFRAMQTYGLIFSSVGSDMFISGTFDTRWNNGVLNPEFAKLSAEDFEVVKLGWQP